MSSQIGHSNQLRASDDRTSGTNEHEQVTSSDDRTANDADTDAEQVKPSRTALVMTIAAVGIRVSAAIVLLIGPWVDEAAELAGWDIERFLAIAGESGRAWRDTAVEYPPGSVVVFELLERFSPRGAADLVTAHRFLVVIGLTADLMVAWLLHRRNERVGLTYLILGLPLVPMGLLRLDLVATLPAVAAVLLAIPPRATAERGSGAARAATSGGLVAIGAMIKLWPALLIPALWSTRRDRAAAAGIAGCAAATLAWLVWADAGLDPVRQVVDLRGATGWQLESIGGVVTALADAVGLRPLGPSEGVRLELNAFRVGTLRPWVVTVGRVVAVVAMAALAWRARRTVGRPNLQVFGAMMLGCVAALIVTSPLLSPQFVLWLTPWAALVAADDHHRPNLLPPGPVALTASITVTTGLVLTIFSPPDLADPVAATMLAVRNGLLLVVPISCWRWLGRTAPPSAA